MELLDARLGLLVAGAAAVSSEQVRKTVGRGLGYAITGAIALGGPVARPLIEAGRDIFEEARTVAGTKSSTKTRSSRSRTSAR
jgi:predicted membrane protein